MEDSKGADQKGKDFKGNDAEGMDAKGEGAKGKDAEGNDSKMRKDIAESRRTPEAPRGNYSSHTESAKNWGPARCRDVYSYTQWISQNDWTYMDGNWRETRNPALGEVSEIDGGCEETRLRGIR